jgi:hypothetical protein
MTMLMVLYLTTSLLRSGKEKHCLLFLRKIVNKTTDSSSSSQKVFTKPREEESKNVPDTQNKVGLVSRHTKVYKNTARGYTKLDRGLVHAPFSMAGWWPGGNVVCPGHGHVQRAFGHVRGRSLPVCMDHGGRVCPRYWSGRG